MPVEEMEEIKGALAHGRLTALDVKTGYEKSLRARCPHDGHESLVYRTEKMGESISRVIFRCGQCGRQFDATPEQMTLR